jgi:hypothetical protein
MWKGKPQVRQQTSVWMRARHRINRELTGGADTQGRYDA